MEKTCQLVKLLYEAFVRWVYVSHALNLFTKIDIRKLCSLRITLIFLTL
jgi:hypothetical protein